MNRIGSALLAVALVLATAPAWAQDEEPNLELFYPIVTRRPIIERELELGVHHARGRDGRVTEVTGAIELPVLPRWQVELEVPLIFTDPREGFSAGGIGDLELQNKVLVWKSLEQRAQVAVGLEARFPTGSERRGLGGEAAVEPFVTGGVALGDFDVVADVAWEFNVNAHVPGPQEQELSSGLAVGYRWHRLFLPLLELRTVTLTRGADDDPLRHRTQVSIIPGFNARVLPGTTVRFGVELPVTDARSFDYALHAGLVWEF